MRTEVFRVLICWDGRSDIVPCLRSVYADIEGREGWEVVLVLDGCLAIDAFKNMSFGSAVTCLSTEEPQGLTRSLNLALERLGPSVVVRMDADDLWLKGRADITETCFRDASSDIDVFASAAWFYDGLGSRKLVVPKKIDKCIDNALIHPAVAFRSVINGEAVFYDDDFRLAQDYELFNRLFFEKAKFSYGEFPVIEYYAPINRHKRIAQLSYLMLANTKFLIAARIGNLSYLFRCMYIAFKIFGHSILLLGEEAKK